MIVQRNANAASNESIKLNDPINLHRSFPPPKTCLRHMRLLRIKNRRPEFNLSKLTDIDKLS